MEERLKTVLAQILDISSQTIDDETAPATVAGWDSLKQMQIMLAIEDEFSVRFTDDQIHELQSYSSIRQALSALQKQ